MWYAYLNAGLIAKSWLAFINSSDWRIQPVYMVFLGLSADAHLVSKSNSALDVCMQFCKCEHHQFLAITPLSILLLRFFHSPALRSVISKFSPRMITTELHVLLHVQNGPHPIAYLARFQKFCPNLQLIYTGRTSGHCL
jgi:hypothetical protein